MANLSGFPLQETSPQAEIERCLDRGKRANFLDELWPIRYMTGSDFVISYRTILTEMGIAMKRIVLAAAAAYLGCASFAFAADMVIKAPTPVPVVPAWTGFYGGLNGGWGWGDQNDWNVGSTLAGQSKLSGGLFGGQVGYNWQMGTLLFGVQGDGNWANIKGTVSNNRAFAPDTRCWSGGDQTADCSTNIKAMGNLTARIGFLPAPNTLIYGKFGVNWSSMDFKVGNVIDLTGGTCSPIGSRSPGYNSVNETRTGLTAGLGVEQRVYDHITVFGEYSVVDNGGSSNPLFTGGTGNFGCTPNFNATVTTKPTGIVKFGINYLFN